jgi:hypothetical protein
MGGGKILREIARFAVRVLAPGLAGTFSRELRQLPIPLDKGIMRMPLK